MPKKVTPLPVEVLTFCKAGSLPLLAFGSTTVRTISVLCSPLAVILASGGLNLPPTRPSPAIAKTLGDPLSLLSFGKACRASVCNRRCNESAQGSRGGRARQDFWVRHAEQTPCFLRVLWGADQSPACLCQSCVVPMCELEFALEVALEAKHDRRRSRCRDEFVVVRCTCDHIGFGEPG